MNTQPLKLGLIGDNIADSSAPRLHVLAGQSLDRVVTYDRLVPNERGMAFEDLFDWARDQGYHGLNITYPYKARAAALCRIEDPLTAAMGAVNTVIFSQDDIAGFNTDYTGFIAACRRSRGGVPAGDVALIGAGGVGKAMAFGLVELGATRIAITDLDARRAETLAIALQGLPNAPEVVVVDDVAKAVVGANGILNASPIGMVGYDGTPVPAKLMQDADWAFDAIYTPLVTRFIADARAGGLVTIPGWELFIHQGLDAWRLFDGRDADEAGLRAALSA